MLSLLQTLLVQTTLAFFILVAFAQQKQATTWEEFKDSVQHLYDWGLYHPHLLHEELTIFSKPQLRFGIFYAVRNPEQANSPSSSTKKQPITQLEDVQSPYRLRYKIEQGLRVLKRFKSNTYSHQIVEDLEQKIKIKFRTIAENNKEDAKWTKTIEITHNPADTIDLYFYFFVDSEFTSEDIFWFPQNSEDSVEGPFKLLQICQKLLISVKDERDTFNYQKQNFEINFFDDYSENKERLVHDLNIRQQENKNIVSKGKLVLLKTTLKKSASSLPQRQVVHSFQIDFNQQSNQAKKEAERAMENAEQQITAHFKTYNAEHFPILISRGAELFAQLTGQLAFIDNRFLGFVDNGVFRITDQFVYIFALAHSDLTLALIVYDSLSTHNTDSSGYFLTRTKRFSFYIKDARLEGESEKLVAPFHTLFVNYLMKILHPKHPPVSLAKNVILDFLRTVGRTSLTDSLFHLHFNSELRRFDQKDPASQTRNSYRFVWPCVTYTPSRCEASEQTGTSVYEETMQRQKNQNYAQTVVKRVDYLSWMVSVSRAISQLDYYYDGEQSGWELYYLYQYYTDIFTKNMLDKELPIINDQLGLNKNSREISYHSLMHCIIGLYKPDSGIQQACDNATLGRLNCTIGVCASTARDTKGYSAIFNYLITGRYYQLGSENEAYRPVFIHLRTIIAKHLHEDVTVRGTEAPKIGLAQRIIPNALPIYILINLNEYL